MRLRQEIDREHLRLLSIFYYVVAGLNLFGSCFPAIYLFIGIAFLNMPPPGPNQPPPPPRELGWVFIIGSTVAIAIIWVQAILNLVAGRGLSGHHSYRLCQIAAILNCLAIPLGTILGVFTLIVLSRPGVRVLFGLEEPRELVYDRRRDDEDWDEDDRRRPRELPPEDGSFRPGSER